ncbi:MAG: hypothetical protein AAFY88_11510 [Acidobacteriota bacterium]
MHRTTRKILALALVALFSVALPGTLVADDQETINALCTQRAAQELDDTDRSNICPLTQEQYDDEDN